MKIEIPNEALDEFFVQALKEGLDCVRKNGWVKHSEDIVNNKKIEAAFLTLIEYYMCHSEFTNFIQEEYNGSDSDS